MADNVAVLVIDDNSPTALIVRELVENTLPSEHVVEHVSRLEECVPLLQVKNFDVFFIVCTTPGWQEFEAIHCLDDLCPAAAIVVISDTSNEGVNVELIEAGAQEVLCTKQIRDGLLFCVINHAIARQRRLMRYKNAALLDGLTGIANRRALDLELDRQLAMQRRHRVPFSFLLMDIDEFKAFNDQHGHLVGDHVLRDVAEVLPRDLRRSDMVARFGGEEYAVVLPATDLFGAEIVAERLRLAVFSHVCTVDSQTFQVSASIGVAMAQSEDDVAALVEKADAALYAAKKAGRNCCYAHDDGQHRLVDAMDLARSSKLRICAPS